MSGDDGGGACWCALEAAKEGERKQQQQQKQKQKSCGADGGGAALPQSSKKPGEQSAKPREQSAKPGEQSAKPGEKSASEGQLGPRPSALPSALPSAAPTPCKYRCPGCGTGTCSVACCRAHKAASGCSGKRDRTGFVPLSGFGEAELRGDLRFLEDVGREADCAKRRRPVGLSATSSRKRRPGMVQHVVRAAAAQGVELRVMPAGMSRREANTTYVDRKSKRIHWRVEWTDGEGGAVLATDRAVPETTTLRDAFAKHLGDREAVGFRLAGGPADPDAPLADALRACCATNGLIEFPTIAVALSDAKFPVELVQVQAKSPLHAPSPLH